MRKGEINALKWSDIDDKIIHVRRSIAQKLKGDDRETSPKKMCIRDSNKFEYQKSTSANVLNFFVFLTHNLQSLLTISNYIFPHNTQYQNAIHIYHPS